MSNANDLQKSGYGTKAPDECEADGCNASLKDGAHPVSAGQGRKMLCKACAKLALGR